MSLLIDALRQAEATQRQQNPAMATDAAIQLEPVALPEIPVPTAPPTTPLQNSAAMPRTNQRATSREATRALFEVKRSASPSRLPLTLAAGGLALLVVGAAYIWWATQPRGGMQLGAEAPLSNISTKPSPAATPITPLRQPQAESYYPPVISAPAAAEPKSKMAAATTPTREAALSKHLQSDTPETPVLRRSPATPPVNDATAPIQQAFAAYAAGDLAAARQGLLGVLRSEPKNIDALNAMAMIALRGGRPEEAERYYRQALVVDPKDANTRAQLVLLYGEGDPATAESRLRQLLAEQPESATALFALGSIYARQSRWNEAQRAFFQAHTLDSTNADTLYNLAVSLDHLNQPKLAQQYYERAAATGRRGQIAFDPEAARKRASILQGAVSSNPASP